MSPVFKAQSSVPSETRKTRFVLLVKSGMANAPTPASIFSFVAGIMFTPVPVKAFRENATIPPPAAEGSDIFFVLRSHVTLFIPYCSVAPGSVPLVVAVTALGKMNPDSRANNVVTSMLLTFKVLALIVLNAEALPPKGTPFPPNAMIRFLSTRQWVSLAGIA